jgi:hypothetical protein
MTPLILLRRPTKDRNQTKLGQGRGSDATVFDEVFAVVSTENWHEERARLVQLLDAIEAGEITHIDQQNLGQLQVANPGNVAALRDRLAKLNGRLGEDEA